MEDSAMNTVDPYLKGYSAFNQDVSVFAFGDVIVAKNYRENNRVRLVSGGISSHIQYVGKGMLTASVQGSDGDTGSRLKHVADVLIKRTCNKKLNMEYPFTFFLSLSKLLENTVGSTMGCIYSIIFEAAANKFGEYKEEDDITAFIWLEALENACDAVKRYGNVEKGDNTMYDPLEACATTIRQNMTQTNTISSFGMGVAKAEENAQNTKKSGQKYPDAGAHAVGIWLRAIFEGVKLRVFE